MLWGQNDYCETIVIHFIIYKKTFLLIMDGEENLSEKFSCKSFIEPFKTPMKSTNDLMYYFQVELGYFSGIELINNINSCKFSTTIITLKYQH